MDMFMGGERQQSVKICGTHMSWSKPLTYDLIRYSQHQKHKIFIVQNMKAGSREVVSLL